MTDHDEKPFDPASQFEVLVESAFEFLERAIAEFEKSPKFSTIHFATAVELFLKARLMREHWVLIAEDPGQAVRRSFAEGRIRTVSAKTAIERLSAIAGVTIPEGASKAFKRIAEHRNRMIHFVHGVAGAGPNDQTVQQVAAEQCLGWFHLALLLTEWKEAFGKWSSRAKKVERSMRGHRSYLKASFKALGPEIKRQRDAGIRFEKCASCGHAAASTSSISDHLAATSCLVCQQSDWLITLTCPDDDCGLETAVGTLQSEQPSCRSCGYTFLEEDFAAQLDTSPYDDFGRSPINCAGCASPDTVVEHHRHYICSECRAVEEDAETCEWCHETQIGGGSLEDSEWSGCEFCDGRAGWEKD